MKLKKMESDNVSMFQGYEGLGGALAGLRFSRHVREGLKRHEIFGKQPA